MLKNIELKFDKNISSKQIQTLYLSVGWQYREAEDIEKALKRSMVVVSAWDAELLVGVARAVSDGVFSAIIWDVAVEPTYQHKGLGKIILQTMLTKLDDCGISLITLYTDYAKKDFYAKLGFENNNQVLGMFRYKR
ncbi:MAG: GNAT family N-acetyltransferase [Candidatus Gastranaerophilales bacterium]|nr:GNAT family N-acetyltransferase [Candidatus Gastranaerophilales bacterium]